MFIVFFGAVFCYNLASGAGIISNETLHISAINQAIDLLNNTTFTPGSEVVVNISMLVQDAQQQNLTHFKIRVTSCTFQSLTYLLIVANDAATFPFEIEVVNNTFFNSVLVLKNVSLQSPSSKISISSNSFTNIILAGNFVSLPFRHVIGSTNKTGQIVFTGSLEIANGASVAMRKNVLQFRGTYVSDPTIRSTANILFINCPVAVRNKSLLSFTDSNLTNSVPDISTGIEFANPTRIDIQESSQFEVRLLSISAGATGIGFGTLVATDSSSIHFLGMMISTIHSETRGSGVTFTSLSVQSNSTFEISSSQIRSTQACITHSIVSCVNSRYNMTHVVFVGRGVGIAFPNFLMLSQQAVMLLDRLTFSGDLVQSITKTGQMTLAGGLILRNSWLIGREHALHFHTARIFMNPGSYFVIESNEMQVTGHQRQNAIPLLFNSSFFSLRRAYFRLFDNAFVNSSVLFHVVGFAVTQRSVVVLDELRASRVEISKQTVDFGSLFLIANSDVENVVISEAKVGSTSQFIVSNTTINQSLQVVSLVQEDSGSVVLDRNRIKGFCSYNISFMNASQNGTFFAFGNRLPVGGCNSESSTVQEIIDVPSAFITLCNKQLDDDYTTLTMLPSTFASMTETEPCINGCTVNQYTCFRAAFEQSFQLSSTMKCLTKCPCNLSLPAFYEMDSKCYPTAVSDGSTMMKAEEPETTREGPWTEVVATLLPTASTVGPFPTTAAPHSQIPAATSDFETSQLPPTTVLIGTDSVSFSPTPTTSLTPIVLPMTTSAVSTGPAVNSINTTLAPTKLSSSSFLDNKAEVPSGKTVQGITSATTVTVAAATLANGAAAMDIQSVGIIAFVSCANGATKGATKAASKSVRPYSIGNSENANLYGIVTVGFGLCLLHAVAVWIVKVVNKVSWTTASATLHHPKLSFHIAVLVQQGFAFEAIESVRSQQGDRIVLGLVLLLVLLICSSGAHWVQNKTMGALQFTKYRYAMDRVQPKWLAMLMPYHYWKARSAPANCPQATTISNDAPDAASATVTNMSERAGGENNQDSSTSQIVNQSPNQDNKNSAFSPSVIFPRYGPVFIPFQENRIRAVHIPFLRALLVAIIASIQTESHEGCRAQFIALASVSAVTGIVTMALLPFRMKLLSACTLASSFASSIGVLTGGVKELNDHSETIVTGVTIVVTLSSAMVLIAPMYEQRVYTTLEDQCVSNQQHDNEEMTDKKDSERGEEEGNAILSAPLLLSSTDKDGNHQDIIQNPLQNQSATKRAEKESHPNLENKPKQA